MRLYTEIMTTFTYPGETAKMNAQWYTIFCKPNKEAQVADYLHNNVDVTIYHPTLRVKPVNPRASKTRPYFPRYIFVHTDLETIGFHALRWIPGAIGLVEFGGEPAIIPAEFIRALRQRIAEIEAAGGLQLDGLEHGDPVCVKHGPFAGYDAIFDTRLSGEKRVQVLLYWMGREMKVKLSSNVLEKRRKR